MGSTFTRNKPLFFFLIGLVVTFIIIYLLWEPLLPFFIGFLIAYMLHPIIERVHKKLPYHEKKKGVLQRIAIIIVAFLLILALVCGLVYLMVISISGPFAKMIANAPTLITEGLEQAGTWFHSVIEDLTLQQQAQINQAVANIGTQVGTWIQNSFVGILPRVFSSFGSILGFFILPFFLIFFMPSIPSLGRQFYSLFSPEVGYHVRNFFRILDTVFGRYIRASIIAGIIMGILVIIIFFILDVPLAVPQGFIFGVFQLIPSIGGAIAMVIGCILVLAVEPSKLLAAFIVYLVINLVVSTVLLAKLQGSAVKIEPAIIMILIVIGSFLGGIVGMILIVPIVAVVYAIIKYTRDEIRRTRIEAADTSSETGA